MSKVKAGELKKAKKAVEKYAALLKKEGFPIQGVYIFGSYARGDFRKDSDIDVCVVSPILRDNWDDNERRLWRLASKIDLRIEPIGCDLEDFRTSVALSMDIKEKGIRVI